MSEEHPFPCLPEWLEREVAQKVADLLDNRALTTQLRELMPADDDEFAEALAYRELALIAAGVPRLEVAFRIAVLRGTRDALSLLAAIDLLPVVATE